MQGMNPKSAWALSWFALIVNLLGLMALSLSAQFMFSAIAAVLSLIPTVFARKKSQIFAVVVLMVSLVLVVTGYPNFKEEQAQLQQRAMSASGHVSVPPGAKAFHKSLPTQQ